MSHVTGNLILGCWCKGRAIFALAHGCAQRHRTLHSMKNHATIKYFFNFWNPLFKHKSTPFHFKPCNFFNSAVQILVILHSEPPSKIKLFILCSFHCAPTLPNEEWIMEANFRSSCCEASNNKKKSTLSCVLERECSSESGGKLVSERWKSASSLDRFFFCLCHVESES